MPQRSMLYRDRNDVRFIGTVVASRLRSWPGALVLLAAIATGCGDGPSDCARCGTLVIATAGNPDALLPPLVRATVGRDISDLMYERLGRLEAGGLPVDSSDFQPGLARDWRRIDSVTLEFRLRPGAEWHDGRPVTAADVAFSFAAYADSGLDTSNREILERLTVTTPDDSTVVIRFPEPHPEQWYDATWAVRVLPRHVWDTIPRSRWAEDTTSQRLIGSGPYRLATWVKGQSLTLERTENGRTATGIQRVVWRFANDQDAALNLLLSHEADLLETVGDSARIARVQADSVFTLLSYPSAVYGFLGFNLDAPATSPLRSREVRRALGLATDRAAAARAVFGPEAVAPPGPMSRALWVNDPAIAVLPFDPGRAAQALDAAGWPKDAQGVRQRGGRTLAVDILVPATSVTRRNLAQVLQEMWRQAGIRATVTTVDFPVFQERLRSGRFQSFIGAWLDEPSPRALAAQWTAAGIGSLNYVRYRSPVFDSLYQRAARFQGTTDQARAVWREALDTLNADVPAIWLYTPTLAAAATRRLEGFAINPYSWLSGLPEWSLRDKR